MCVDDMSNLTSCPVHASLPMTVSCIDVPYLSGYKTGVLSL